MTVVSVIELVSHIISENDDKTFKEAMLSFLMVFSLIIIKLILKQNRWLEDNAVFLQQATQIFFLTECSIVLSPN